MNVLLTLKAVNKFLASLYLSTLTLTLFAPLETYGQSVGETAVVSGACGSDNDSILDAAPEANLCFSGASSGVAFAELWAWACYGSNGGLSQSCSAFMSAEAVAAKPTRRMVEFRQAALNYYVMTAKSGDIALLDSVPAFQRTGESFPIYSTQQAGSQAITRFYFDQVGVGGRGSHFYTLLDTDINDLTALNPDNLNVPGKPQNEGVEGYAMLPVVPGQGGRCASGLNPVYRLFRNAPGDPNHRFTASLAIYNDYLVQHWVGEGVAFCIPAEPAVAIAQLEQAEFKSQIAGLRSTVENFESFSSGSKNSPLTIANGIYTGSPGIMVGLWCIFSTTPTCLNTNIQDGTFSGFAPGTTHWGANIFPGSSGNVVRVTVTGNSGTAQFSVALPLSGPFFVGFSDQAGLSSVQFHLESGSVNYAFDDVTTAGK